MCRLDQLGREPERLRGRVGVLEAAGIGDERDVERLGELRRQLDPEGGDDVAKHFSGRRRLGVDEVEVAEARIVVVVVDVERERRRVQRCRVGAETALVRRVHGHERPLGGIVRELPLQLLQTEEAVLTGERRGPRQEHDAVLAERRQGDVRREQRAEGVAVGVLVRGDEEALAVADRLDDRPEVSLRHALVQLILVRGRAHR